MEENARPIALEEKFQNGFADVEIQVEGAVNEFELLHAAVSQMLQRAKQRPQRKLAHWNVEGRQTELARERTTAGSLHINYAVGDIFAGVKVIGQGQFTHIRRVGRDNFMSGHAARQQLLANLSELEV